MKNMINDMYLFYRKKVVWVTGGSGFIGSHLVDQLLEMDAIVIVFDNLLTGSIDNISHLLDNKNFYFIQVDLSESSADEWMEKISSLSASNRYIFQEGFDRGQTSGHNQDQDRDKTQDQILDTNQNQDRTQNQTHDYTQNQTQNQNHTQNKKVNANNDAGLKTSNLATPDVVFHLASPASPQWYQAYPRLTYKVNSFVTDELLNLINKNNNKARFIFASTSEVYGDPTIHPQDEKYWGNVNPNGIRSCYDESKRLGESICKVFEREYGSDVRIARIFNTYGPRLSKTDGRVISNFITQSLEGKKLSVYGDGQQTRSYCFVSDLVRGLLSLGCVDKLEHNIINLGNPDEFSIIQTAQIIYELIVKEPLHQGMVEFLDLPQDDPVRRKPDISRAQELLDWYPEVSFREGIQEMVKFYLQRGLVDEG